MSEEEFVKKLLGGERDFNKICLPDGADLRRFIPELNDYLTEQELAKDKIVLCNSRIIRIIAPKIYIPYSNMSRVNMSGANMYGAHMSGADMSGADMSGADMSGANMSGADMSGANMSGVDMTGANMYEANMYGAHMNGAHMNGADMYRADVSGANMSGVDIRGTQNLGSVIGLDSVIFNNTIVTKNEMKEILKARERLNLFDLR